MIESGQLEVRAGLVSHLDRLWCYGLVFRQGVTSPRISFRRLVSAPSNARANSPWHPARPLALFDFRSIWLNELRSRRIRQGAGRRRQSRPDVRRGSGDRDEYIGASSVEKGTNASPSQQETLFLAYVESLAYRDTAECSRCRSEPSWRARRREFLSELNPAPESVASPRVTAMTEMPTGRPAMPIFAFLDGEFPPRRRNGWRAGLRATLSCAGGAMSFPKTGAPYSMPPRRSLPKRRRPNLERRRQGLHGYRVERPAANNRRPFFGLRSRPRLALLAAGIALFALVSGRPLPPEWREAAGIKVASDSEDDGDKRWRADMSLYTPETIVGISDDPTHRKHEFAAVGAKLGIHLPPSRFRFPALR